MAGNKPHLKKKNILVFNEYGNSSSIHGVRYILTNDGSVCDRLLWLVIFLISVSLAIILTIQSYNNWQDKQVITTIKDLDKPVAGMEFPAVTVCASGLRKDMVEKVVKNNFEAWTQGDQNNKSMEQYMLEVFQLENKDIDILDIIDTMLAPDDESAKASFVMQNEMKMNCKPAENDNGGRIRILDKLGLSCAKLRKA